MTVKALSSLLKGLPADMEVVLETEGETFTTACEEQSAVETVTLADEEDKEYEQDFLFIRPCTCHIEDAPVVLVEQNLN